MIRLAKGKMCEHRMGQRSISPRNYDEEYFLAVCSGYKQFIESQGRVLSPRLQRLFDLSNITSGMQVLDVGCGRGEMTLQCAMNGANAIGIDYSSSAIKIAKRIGESIPELKNKIHFQKMDATQLRFDNHIFDIVFLLDVVEHLFPAQLKRALSEIHRVLRPHGILIIHTDNLWWKKAGEKIIKIFACVIHLVKTKYSEICFSHPTKKYEKLHVNYQSLHSLAKVLRDQGFSGNIWFTKPSDIEREILVYLPAQNKFVLNLLGNGLIPILIRTSLYALFAPSISAKVYKQC